VEGCLKIYILEVHVGLSLVHKQFSHLDMVIEGCQVERCVTIILLLIHNPGSRQFHKENPHSTANRNCKQEFSVLCYFSFKFPKTIM
jgi:hypothetical protein